LLNKPQLFFWGGVKSDSSQMFVNLSENLPDVTIFALLALFFSEKI
jgi:hypothetical protein